jgi:type IV pilus assembly protein PilB
MRTSQSSETNVATNPLDEAVAVISSRERLSAALAGARYVHRASIGTLLSAAGVVDQTDLRDALAEQEKHPEARLGNVLVSSGKITEDELYRALGEQMGIPYVRLGDFDIEPAALAALPHDFVRARRVLPLMLHEGRLVIATDDPADSSTLSALRFRAQRPLEGVLAAPSDLDAAIATHYPPFDDAGLLAEAERLGPAHTRPAEEASVEHLALGKPIVRLVNNLLLNAVQRRASDIHLCSRENWAEARCRIDGSLVLVGKFNTTLMPAIVARVKILASLDVTERRLPQDGAIHIDTPHGPVDLRVSVIPAIYGESVVIRILDRSVGLRRLADVGFDTGDERRVRALLERTQGLVLVTGPTGSGKTTTLYAALQELNTGEYQIVTVEDPVEYRIDGLVQIPAQPALDWGFAQALRHILRHDPDIILIGEMRDALTAKAAIESALTGHLVFSTLHTNSASQSITRLLEIGIPAYLVNATLAGVLAQRLARRTCSRCRKPETPSVEIRELLGITAAEQFWRGKGCEECSGTGYRGRIAVYELLQMSPALRELIGAQATDDQIEQQAVKEGMRPLTGQALALARSGTISLDEVLRVRIA